MRAGASTMCGDTDGDGFCDTPEWLEGGPLGIRCTGCSAVHLEELGVDMARWTGLNGCGQ